MQDFYQAEIADELDELEELDYFRPPSRKPTRTSGVRCSICDWSPYNRASLSNPGVKASHFEEDGFTGNLCCNICVKEIIKLQQCDRRFILKYDLPRSEARTIKRETERLRQQCKRGNLSKLDRDRAIADLRRLPKARFDIAKSGVTRADNSRVIESSRFEIDPKLIPSSETYEDRLIALIDAKMSSDPEGEEVWIQTDALEALTVDGLPDDVEQTVEESDESVNDWKRAAREEEQFRSEMKYQAHTYDPEDDNYDHELFSEGFKFYPPFPDVDERPNEPALFRESMNGRNWRGREENKTKSEKDEEHKKKVREQEKLLRREWMTFLPAWSEAAKELRRKQ